MCETQQKHFQFLSSVKYMRPEVYFHTLTRNFRFKFIKYHKKITSRHANTHEAQALLHTKLVPDTASRKKSENV